MVAASSLHLPAACFLIQLSNSPSFGVVARLDRAIQYCRGVCAQAEAPLEYWMPRMKRGMTAEDKATPSRGAHGTRVMHRNALAGMRGRRECRMLAAPASLACKESALTHASNDRAAETTDIPCANGVNGCFVLSLECRAC